MGCNGGVCLSETAIHVVEREERYFFKLVCTWNRYLMHADPKMAISYAKYLIYFWISPVSEATTARKAAFRVAPSSCEGSFSEGSTSWGPGL